MVFYTAISLLQEIYLNDTNQEGGKEKKNKLMWSLRLWVTVIVCLCVSSVCLPYWIEHTWKKYVEGI